MHIFLRDDYRRTFKVLQHIVPSTHFGDNHLTDASADVVLLHNEQATCLLDRTGDRLFIPWLDRAEVDQLNIKFGVHRFERFFNQFDTIAPSDKREERTLADNACSTEWHGRDVCNRLFRPHEMLGE